MNEVLKYVLKWLSLVCVSFAFVFVIMYATRYGGLVESIYYNISTKEKPILYSMENTKIEEIAKEYQEFADKVYAIDESANEKMREMNKLYEKYPVGITLFLSEIAKAETTSNLYFTSMKITGIVGIIIYLILIMKLKKGKSKNIPTKIENKDE